MTATGPEAVPRTNSTSEPSCLCTEALRIRSHASSEASSPCPNPGAARPPSIRSGTTSRTPGPSSISAYAPLRFHGSSEASSLSETAPPSERTCPTSARLPSGRLARARKSCSDEPDIEMSEPRTEAFSTADQRAPEAFTSPTCAVPTGRPDSAETA